MQNTNGRIHACPVETSLEMISGKWKPRILLHLYRNEVMRYGELKRALDGITAKVLTEQLRELESDTLVKRTEYDQVPPKVEYSLSPFGQTLAPVLDTIAIWGIDHQQQLIEILQQDHPDSSVVFVGDCEWYTAVDQRS